MFHTLKRRLIAGSVCAAALVPLPLVAQEAVFVFASNEVGIPNYNPLTAVNTNAAFTMIYDTLVEQDGDLSFHPRVERANQTICQRRGDQPAPRAREEAGVPSAAPIPAGGHPA